MKKFNYRKPAVAAAIVGGVLAVTGTAAFAYWTANGTGSGTAGTAAASTPLTITQDTFGGSALTPGGTAQPVSGTVTNTNTFNVPFVLTAAATVDAGTPCARPRGTPSRCPRRPPASRRTTTPTSPARSR